MDEIIFEKMLRAVQKPGRYVGGERNAVIKDKSKVDLRFAFCFPDVYEVGMSHLGMKILYSIINDIPNVWCERAFAPWFDMKEQMEKNNFPLFALESKDSLSKFDVLAFTLQYEMSFTNVLLMLKLAGVPIFAKDRGENDPLVIGGGPCACNPEPVADFFDVFQLGDGEEMAVDTCNCLIECKKKGLNRHDTLVELSKIDGIYIPSFYEISYKNDGTISEIKTFNNAPMPVKKRLLLDLDKAKFPKNFVVPMIEIIHDRATVEVLRGCIRGCRFCQAGYIYRPFRARSTDILNRQSRSLCSDGFTELSLTSLSTSDHPELELLLDKLLTWTEDSNVNLSLPSLRIDTFSGELADKITRVRRGGLTFAPEAGTQRLRDVINKNITEEEIMDGCRSAFENGYTAVKLYFMLGLPTETDEDIVGIAQLAQRIVDLFYYLPNKPKGKGVSVNISCSCFIPKPFTPFQYCAQDTVDEFERKQRLLISSLTSRKINVSWHDASTSFVEGVLARGDRRLSSAIYEAFNDGSCFDSWDEGFSLERWNNAFEKAGCDPSFYANREIPFDEVRPYDLFDYGVNKEFLYCEYTKAKNAQTTPNCREQCSNCGIIKMIGGKCVANG